MADKRKCPRCERMLADEEFKKGKNGSICKDCLYSRALIVKFGTDVYAELFDKQRGVCAICQKPEWARAVQNNRGVDRLSLDHDHFSGELRGLLCRTCNRKLGLLEFEMEWIVEAMRYLGIETIEGGESDS